MVSILHLVKTNFRPINVRVNILVKKKKTKTQDFFVLKKEGTFTRGCQDNAPKCQIKYLHFLV